MSEMRSRVGRCAVGLLSLAAASSCHKEEALPALPEFVEAQRAVWQLAPADAMGGLVIADLGHLLGRLRAFKAVLDTGPVTRGYLAEGTALAVKALGFDPLDPDGWRKAGLDPAGPLGVFIGDQQSAELVFRASDMARATNTAMGWVARGGVSDPFDCAPQGAYLRCGTPSWPLASDPSKSLWSHVEGNLATPMRAMELVAYAPLDRGEAQQRFGGADAPVKGLHAGYLGLTAAPERLVVRMGARVDDAQKILPYLQPRAGASLLGLAQGGVQAGRITFSPDKLWALASVTLGQLGQLGQADAMFQAGTGLDLHKDLIDNLTGEIVVAGYRSDRKLGKDGKARSFSDRLASVTVIGMREDQRTRHVANRLGELLGGLTGSFAELVSTMGLKVIYSSTPGDRPVHRFSIELSGELQKSAGFSSTEVSITSTPGGVAIGVGPDAIDELRRHEGGTAEAFLRGLPLPEERAWFQRSAFAFWGRTGDGFAARLRLGAATTLLDAIAPDAAKALLELVEVAQLVYDAVAGFDVSADRAELFYQVSFL